MTDLDTATAPVASASGDLRSGGAPVVSVVMIYYQAERYFEEAIRSVLHQTEPRFELLLVNDGCTDRSPEIAARLAAEDSRIRLLSHPDGGNHGMSATRNRGVTEARSDLVAFLDADDVWDPEHLAVQLATLEQFPDADAVCGRALYWRTWQDPGAADDITGAAFPPGRLVRPPEMLLAYLDDGWTTVPTCSLLVRRDVLTAIGGAEDTFKGMYEDTALLSKLYLRSNVVLTHNVTARYRQHEDSACARATASGEYNAANPSPSRQRFLEWLEAYVHDNVPSPDDRLVERVGRELHPYRRPAWQQAAHRAKSVAVAKVRTTLPDPVRSTLHQVRETVAGTGVGKVRFGSLRRTEPVSRDFGFHRGLPIDRVYIEDFLARHASDIRGRVLEIGDDTYTRRYGGAAVTKADVLHVHEGNPIATFVGDLTDGEVLPSDAFDCVVLTQTLHLLLDVASAVRTVHRILKPGGVVLATVPGISHLSGDEWRHGWYWAITPAAAQRLFEDRFGAEQTEVRHHGNVLTTIAFLQGLSAGELRPEEFEPADPQYPMLVTVRAVRAAE